MFVRKISRAASWFGFCAVLLAVLAFLPSTAHAAAYESYPADVVKAIEMGGDEDNIRLAHAACVVSYSKRVWHGGGYDGTELWMDVYHQMFPGNKWVRCCDSNISAMIRWIGADTTFPTHADNLLKYIQNSDKWDYLGYWDEDESKLLPGDLLAYYGGNVNGKNLKGLHLAMYVGEDIIQDVYKAYVKGTDGDVGKPSSEAKYVAAHSGNANLKNKTNGIGGSGAPCMDTARTAYVKGIYHPGLYQIIRLKGAVSSEASRRAIAARKTIDNGVYRLPLTTKSNVKLSVNNASKASGAIARIDSKNLRASQRWRFTFTTDGYYRIVNVASGKSLSIVGSKATNGKKIVQSGWKGAKRQKWRVDKTAKGYRISSALNKKYSLGTFTGSKKSTTAIRLYKNSNKRTLFWNLRAVKAPVADGVYLLTNGKSKLALAAAKDASKPAKQAIAKTTSGSQQWRLAFDAATGYYTMQNVNTGLYLTAKGETTKQTAYKARKLAQRWEVKASGSAWTIRNADSGKVLSIVKKSKKSTKAAKVVLAKGLSGKLSTWKPQVVQEADVAEPASGSSGSSLAAGSSSGTSGSSGSSGESSGSDGSDVVVTIGR